MEWTTALPDWEKRIVNRQSLIPCKPLFPDEAERALEVFKSLVMVDVIGKPTFGEACDQWVFDFVAAIFGAYDPETNKQLISEYFLLISKKNGKSTIAAGIMVTALIINNRHSAELLILAPTKEVANNAYKPASDIVKETEWVAEFLKARDHIKQIENLDTGATLKVIAADTSTAAGTKASFILIDELWIFGKQQKAEAMLQEAMGGLASRPEGFVIYLSTHSDEPPAGVFKNKLEYFRKLRDGEIINKRSLGVLYEFPQKMLDNADYLNPDNFYVTNPSIGKAVTTEYITNGLSQKTDESSRRIFLAKHLNVEVGQNSRGNRWAGADFWLQRADKTITLQRLLDECEVAVVGIDGGGLDDLFGLSVVGRLRDSNHWWSWCHAWAHESVLDRRKSIASQLRDFEREGDVTIVDSESWYTQDAVSIIEKVKDSGILYKVAVDPAGIGEMVDDLNSVDITIDNGFLIGVTQGYGLMDAIKGAERRLANGTLWHDGSNMMNWCIANLKIEPTATAIRASKQNAGVDKIDPAIAMFNAIKIMCSNPVLEKEPEYQMLVIG